MAKVPKLKFIKANKIVLAASPTSKGVTMIVEVHENLAYAFEIGPHLFRLLRDGMTVALGETPPTPPNAQKN